MNRSDTCRKVQPQDLDSLGPVNPADGESPLSPIIHAITPDIRERSRAQPSQPLPMIALTIGAGASSIAYAICRIDDSGRFHDRAIIETADWRPGERLQVQFVHGVAAFAPSLDGSLVVPRRRSIAVPANTRRALGLAPKDKALLAAAPDSRVVIVYPKTALDEMLYAFHHAKAAHDSRD